MQLFFVCDHSPVQFTNWLGEEAQNIKKVSKRPNGIILLTSYNLNRNYIESIKTDAKIVVFDGPITAKSFKHANLLDLKATESPPYYGIEFTKLNKSVWTKPIDYVRHYIKYDHQAVIIKSIEAKSLLNDLMTAIYVLPSSSQKMVKVALINWLFYDGHIRNVSTLLQILSEKTKITRNSGDRLIEIMSSELAQTYHEALQQKGDAKQVADDYDISDYDIRYMQQIRCTKAEYKAMIKG